MKVVLTLLFAASLFACTAKVDAPAIDWPAPQDDTPLNPTSALDLKITKGTISNFNKFKVQSSASTYEIKFAYKPVAVTTLFYSSEIRLAEGCDQNSYDVVYEWREFTSAGAVLTVTPVKWGESYNLKKDISYEFVVKLSKVACTSVKHSFLMEQP